MSEHTKGPWKWKVKEKNNWHYKYLEGKDRVDVIELSDQYDGPPECGSDIVMEINPANAHLIAAAPDLYDALKEITKHAYKGKVMQIAHKAIAKAEGRE
jgi:hypothetical protein